MGKLIPENGIADFLNTVLYENNFIIIDIWMFVHLFAGLILGLFIKKWYIVFGLLVLWEVFEFLLWGYAFRVESFKNIIWDLAIGMIGYSIAQILL